MTGVLAHYRIDWLMAIAAVPRTKPIRRHADNLEYEADSND